MTATRGPPEHRLALLAAPLPKKAGPGQPWSPDETIGLLDAYEEKSISLKRGQLKAQQWEDVAAAVAAHCGLRDPPKTGTQCRHKMEKLRKRFRSERQSHSSSSSWPFFARMARLERGSLPISSRSPAAAAYAPDESDDGDDDGRGETSNTKSINGILRERNLVFSGALRNPRLQKRRAFEVEDEEEEDEDEEAEAVAPMLAAVIRNFGEGMMRMEKRRMEVMRKVERDWMEMEAKRAEMLIESQRSLLEMISGAFSSIKKAKKSHDDA